MRVIHPLDRAAIKDWIDGCPDAQKGRDVLVSLASMGRGEGWVWSPECGFGPENVQFPLFSTYDSFAPQANSSVEELKGWAAVDLAEVRDKLSAVVEEAKANDPRHLRKQIAELKRQIAGAEPVADEQAIQRAVAARDREWQKAIGDRDKTIGLLKARIERARENLSLNGDHEPAPPPELQPRVSSQRSEPRPRPFAGCRAGGRERGLGRRSAAHGSGACRPLPGWIH